MMHLAPAPEPIAPPKNGRFRLPLARLRWIILGLLFCSTVINYVDRQALSVLLPTLRQELSLSGTAYANIATLFLVAYTIGQLASGMVIDRVGTRKGLIVSVTVWSLAAVGHAFARGAVSLGWMRALLGLGEAGNWPAGGKAIAQWFPRERRAFGMAIFDGGSAVGAIIAPPLVAFLALHYSWRAAFVVTGLLGFVWLAAWMWIYEQPDQHRWLSEADRATAAAETAAPAAKPGAFGAAFGVLVRQRRLWGLMATRMSATPVWWFYVFWLPDYLAKDRGFSLAQIGMFAWIPYVAVDIGKVIGGAVSDALLARGHSVSLARKSVMACGALAMLGGIQVVNAQNSAGAIAWVCVATFGFGLWSANILALHADLFPSSTMGTALGLTGMAASFGGAVVTFVIGRVVDGWGYGPVFLGAGTAALVACLALFFWIGHIGPRGECTR